MVELVLNAEVILPIIGRCEVRCDIVAGDRGMGYSGPGNSVEVERNVGRDLRGQRKGEACQIWKRRTEAAQSHTNNVVGVGEDLQVRDACRENRLKYMP